MHNLDGVSFTIALNSIVNETFFKEISGDYCFDKIALQKI
jgi:hypothetical protein